MAQRVRESEGGGPLGVIFSVAFFRGLDPAEVVRRFSRGEDSGQESDFGGLDEQAHEFVAETDGGLPGRRVVRISRVRRSVDALPQPVLRSATTAITAASAMQVATATVIPAPHPNAPMASATPPVPRDEPT